MRMKKRLMAMRKRVWLHVGSLHTHPADVLNEPFSVTFKSASWDQRLVWIYTWFKKINKNKQFSCNSPNWTDETLKEKPKKTRRIELIGCSGCVRNSCLSLSPWVRLVLLLVWTDFHPHGAVCSSASVWVTCPVLKSSLHLKETSPISAAAMKLPG